MEKLICFCFGYTADDIYQDFLKSGKSLSMEKIQMEKQFGIASVPKRTQRGDDVWAMSARWWQG